MPDVKVIPRKLKRKKAVRVVAYARVSCPKNHMIASLAAQVDYYSDLITKNPDSVLIYHIIIPLSMTVKREIE